MSDAKFTPGPWYVEEQPYKSSSYYIRGSDKHGQRLTWGSGAVAHIPRSTLRPSLANARLIAAAPELYALADRVARLNPDAGEIGAGMLMQLVAEARAAIAKATA